METAASFEARFAPSSYPTKIRFNVHSRGRFVDGKIAEHWDQSRLRGYQAPAHWTHSVTEQNFRSQFTDKQSHSAVRNCRKRVPSGGVGTRKRTDIGARRKLEEVDFPG